MPELARQLRQIAPYLGPYRFRLLVTAILVVAMSVAEVAKPWPLKVVVDHVLGGKPIRWLGFPGALTPLSLLSLAALGLVVLYALLGLLSVATNYVTIEVGQRMVNDFRSDLYQHLQRLSLRFHVRRPAGELLYRLTGDTFAIQTLAMNGVFPTVSALVMLASMVVVMLGLDVELTAIALLVVPVLGLAIRWVSGRITQVATEAKEKEGDLYAIAQRAMSSIKVIQAFTTEEEEHRTFVGQSRASLDANLQLYTVQTAYSTLVNLVVAAGTAAVLWVGGKHVLDAELSVGELLVFSTYLASLYAPINTISNTFGQIQGARVGIRRVFEILDTEPDVSDGRHELARDQVRGEFELRDVVFEYAPGAPVLRGLSLHVQAGESVAIVGSTGAGKTTLVSLLPRFYDPTAGQVLLDGRDLRDLRVRSLRRQIAMVLQPSMVFPISLRDNIAYGRRDASEAEIVAAASAAQLDSLLRKLPAGLGTMVGERGATLSEGECQRVTIARAILRDAPILILDEPTSALDAETEAALLVALERLLVGRTSFVIAHRLSTVRRVDKIAVLRDGVVAEYGSFEELMARGGHFARLYETQTGSGNGERRVGA